jgi:4-amino-4-deoxy-L-arabinose transferase-like glycosyltransferase
MWWLGSTALVLAAVFFFYPLALNVPLVDPDEGLHASIAQEMVEKGDWSHPAFLGKPFLDKPILYTWTQAVSLTVLGMSAAAVRLPGLLFGLLGMITTGLMAWRMFSPRMGVVSAILYATMVIPTALAQCATHDVALVPWINLSVLLFWEADRADSWKTRGCLMLAAGFLLGLSCLTKGFVGVALVGTAYGSYLLVTRRLTVGACLRGALALCVAALVASSWYAAMELRNPGYLYYYFVERHVLGLASSTQKHGEEPWWYYLPILLGGGLPWVIYLPAGIRDWWEHRKGSTLRRAAPGNTPAGHESRSGAIPLMICWVVACSLLLSIAGSKLITYLWPVFPAMAILAAVVWVRVIEGKLSKPARQWFSGNFWITCLTGPALMPAGMLLAQHLLDVCFSWVGWTLGVAAGLTCWIPLVFWRRGDTASALSTGNLALAAQFVVATALIGPTAAHHYSAVDLAQHFNRQRRIPPRVVIVEDRVGSLVFYLDRRLRTELKADQFEEVRAHEMPDLPAMGPGTVIAMAETRAQEASQYVDLEASSYQRAGRYRLYTPAQLATLQQTAAGPDHTHRPDVKRRYAARDGSSARPG